MKEPILNKDTNVREVMEYAMTIAKQKEADLFFQKILDWSKDNWNVESLKPTLENRVMIAKKNLAYWSGYFGQKVQDRVKKLFLDNN